MDMGCPWLEEKDGKSYCTAVSPKVELDFESPPEPGVNGSTCRIPAPAFQTTDPWDACKWYRPK